MLPVLQYSDNEDLRRAVWSASDQLCVEEPFQNEPLIREILKLRQERAEILGKSDFADVALARRMAGNGSKADEFVDEILNKALPFCQKENEELEIFKAEKLAIQRIYSSLGRWVIGLKKLKRIGTISMMRIYDLTFRFNRFYPGCSN